MIYKDLTLNREKYYNNMYLSLLYSGLKSDFQIFKNSSILNITYLSLEYSGLKYNKKENGS